MGTSVKFFDYDICFTVNMESNANNALETAKKIVRIKGDGNAKSSTEKNSKGNRKSFPA